MLEEGRRIEAVDQAWGGRSCGIILTVVASLEDVLQEDTKLLMCAHTLAKSENDLGD